VLLERQDALSAARRAVTLNPLSAGAHSNLGVVQFYLRQYADARASFKEAMRLGDNALTPNWAGTNEIAAGHPADALPYCEPDRKAWYGQWCLVLAYQALGRKSEAGALLQTLRQEHGDELAFQLAEIYAQFDKPDEALEWLATALRQQDGGLSAIKVDPFLDPIRATPQFAAIAGQLQFPR
jgi:tetratricopeptide (TPR) repeat protein